MHSSSTLFPLLVGLVSCTISRVHIQMPVSDIEQEDAYMCFITPMKDYEGQSLVGYEIEALKGVAHHAAALACEDVNSDQIYWDCKAQQGSIGKGRSVVLHGTDAAEIEHAREDFPEDVGLELGPKAKINYILFQIHYKQPFKVTSEDQPSSNLTLFLTDERRKYTRQALLLASQGYIPANTERFSSELIMQWSGITVEADTYYIHSHDYGVLIEGYIIQNGAISLIGRHSPQKHATSIYKMKNGTSLRVSPGDIIAARCIFSNPLNRPIAFGKARSDEMCNFSLIFRYPTEAALVYPRTVLRFQNPQNVTWCQNDVYTSHTLCDMSKKLF